jgi:RNA polymerase sigma-54 factor
MSSGQFLSQRQTLQQRLSPQQIQYIKLLQLPTLAFEQRIKEEMEENPALEEAESFEDKDVNETDSQSAEAEEPSNDQDSDNDSDERQEEPDWEELLHNEDYEGASYQRNQDEDWTELPRPYHAGLLEDLEHQVGLLDLDERQQLIADQILGSLDNDGYFRREVSSVVDFIAFNHGMLVTDEEVEFVLKQIQRLEPTGVAARDLRECLMLQLEALDPGTPGASLAYKILRDEWTAFEKKHFDRLKKRFNADEDALAEAWECIQGLDPKPGATEDDTYNFDYITPDFEVSWLADEKEGEGEFVISLNSRNVPPMRISPVYKSMWDDAKKKKNETVSQKETQLFIKNKIESARWFMESILQRQNTLLNVMRTIVALQNDFFKHGHGLKPMILKDIAERVGMDISTISRVVNGKYVQTNFGVYELKYFFNEGLETADGEEVSNREVKNLLQEIISKENKQSPLSDLALVKELKKRGFIIARRTVSKYREQLNLPVARLRKDI